MVRIPATDRGRQRTRRTEMFEAAVAQLRIAATTAFGIPVNSWPLDRLTGAIGDTLHPFGEIGSDSIAMSGSLTLDEPTRRERHSRAKELQEVQVVHVSVPIAGLPWTVDGIRIGHLSDTHCDSSRAVAQTARAARLLRAQNPDVVFLTGDYITHRPYDRMAAASAVLGNHDWSAGDPDYVAAQLEQVGFTVLRNRSTPVNGIQGLWVVGLEQRCDNRQDPVRALHGVPDEAVKLLLIHEPDFADEAPSGLALQFSGHSHGGQVRIPGIAPFIKPTHGRRYPEGLCQTRQHPVYTTRGVGMVGPKVRLFCPPEVAVIRLVHAEHRATCSDSVRTIPVRMPATDRRRGTLEVPCAQR